MTTDLHYYVNLPNVHFLGWAKNILSLRNILYVAAILTLLFQNLSFCYIGVVLSLVPYSYTYFLIVAHAILSMCMTSMTLDGRLGFGPRNVSFHIYWAC